jgi:hypothetical protein
MPDGDLRPSVWDDELQLAMSTGLSLVEAEVLFAEVETGIDDVRSAVGEPETFPITIGSREADVPVRIENTSSTPLTVFIRLTAEKLAVPGGDERAVLAPNGITETSVPVIARSNGVFPVTIEVLTPAGNPLGEPVEFTARVNNLTGLGRVITVGAALVLISWWFSYYRRRRRSQVDLAAGRHPANGPTETPTPNEVAHATRSMESAPVDASTATKARTDGPTSEPTHDGSSREHSRGSGGDQCDEGSADVVDGDDLASPQGATNRRSE